MLSEAEVKKIAELTRIKLTDDEVEKYKGELSSILDFVKKLNEINTDGVEPLHQTTGLVNSTREDGPRNEFPMIEELNEKLIGQAPHKESRFIKVKSVLKK